jgi:ABC-2 type transport system permease protein
MNTPSDSVPESPLNAPVAAAVATTPTRPLYWSIRRELWENRSIYIAPLIAAALVLLASLLSAGHLPERRRALLLLDPAHQQVAVGRPYDIAALVILVTAFIVAVFYCLDALHGERRDRSILFWKSLPVSDLTTVLSKASIPLVVLPLLTFAIVIATQLFILVLTTVVLMASGLGASVWIQPPWLQSWLTLIYALVVLALWHAPIYGWLLLVSGWAKRATFLWAILSPLALCIVEKIAFGTSYSASLLKDRFIGFAEAAFAFDAHGTMDSLVQLTPGRFLSTPGLWIGLAVAVAFIAAAVRLRRYREPI